MAKWQIENMAESKTQYGPWNLSRFHNFRNSKYLKCCKMLLTKMFPNTICSWLLDKHRSKLIISYQADLVRWENLADGG